MADMNPTFAWAGDVAASTFERCMALVRHYSDRDTETSIMRAVRRGHFDAISADAFSEDFPAPVIANQIDIMARDMAAVLTPLPTVSCPPASTLHESAKKFADRRTRIAQNYVHMSSLQAQMPDGADSYNCYGMFVAEVRPDLDCKMPKIKLMDGGYAYPVWDADLNVTEILLVTYVSEQQLASYYPDAAAKVTKDYPAAVQRDRIRVYRYQNAKQTLVFLPEAKNLVLENIPNKMGKCTFVAIPRPMGEDWYTVPRGAYSDLVWPQLAANDLRMLALEATEKAVRAPIVVPTDVTDVAFGPDATIRTNNPAGVGRLKIDVPQIAFQSTEIVSQDIMEGGMSPQARTGQVHASIITGAGVDALGQGYSQQVALAQSRIGEGIRRAIMLCFEMDEKYWPNEAKDVMGQSLESPEKITYTPAKDIKGDHFVVVDYGFLLGLDPNRALLFILQALSAGLISKDTATRNLPIKLNLVEENSRIQLEQLRASMLEAIAATSQAIPQMVVNGASPGELLAQLSAIIAGVDKGENIETVVAKVFKQPEAAEPPPAPPGLPGAPGEGAPGGQPGVEQGDPNAIAQTGAAPPSLQDFFASMGSNGQANMNVRTRRRALI